MLQSSPVLSTFSEEKVDILMRLAYVFEEESEKAIQLGPDELAKAFGIGNKDQWKEFLQLTPVENFIKSEIAFLAQVAVRRNLPGLSAAAKSGDVQSIKLINDMAGILNTGDSNKIFVLHKVNRQEIPSAPSEQPTEQPN